MAYSFSTFHIKLHLLSHKVLKLHMLRQQEDGAQHIYDLFAPSIGEGLHFQLLLHPFLVQQRQDLKEFK